jgi:flagellar M-ring protein FliF
MLGLLGFAVVLFVLRPLAGQVVATLKEPLALGGGGRMALASLSEETGQAQRDNAAIMAGTAAAALPEFRPIRSNSNDPIYQDVMEHIRREPAQSTRLLETWIGAPEEDEE